MADHLDRSVQLSNKINEYIDGFDEVNQEDGELERTKVTELSDVLDRYNKNKNPTNKQTLFECLYALMQTTPIFFSYVLRTNMAEKENLNVRLRDIFFVESKWYTTHPNSSEYDHKRGIINEKYRLRYCSMKNPIPSVLFLEFLLFVCTKIDELTQTFSDTIQKKDVDEDVAAARAAVDVDLAKGIKDSILCKINLIGKISRISDNDSVLNTGCDFHTLQIITPESSDVVGDIKRRLLVFYKKWTRWEGSVTPANFSLSSTLGTLCDEIIKKFIPEDASGFTQNSPSPDRSSEIKVRNAESVSVLEEFNSPIRFLQENQINNIAKSFGWCQFLFTSSGCNRTIGANEGKNDTRKHHELYKHPGYTKATFDVCNEMPMKNLRFVPYGGGKSLKKYRKNNIRHRTKRRHHTRHRRTKHRRRH